MKSSEEYGNYYSKVGRPSTLDKARLEEAKRKGRKAIAAWAVISKQGHSYYKSQLQQPGRGENIGMTPDQCFDTLAVILKDAPPAFSSHLGKWYRSNGSLEVEVHNEPENFSKWRLVIENYMTKCAMSNFEKAVKPPEWPWK